MCEGMLPVGARAGWEYWLVALPMPPCHHEAYVSVAKASGEKDGVEPCGAICAQHTSALESGQRLGPAMVEMAFGRLCARHVT